MTEHLTVVHKRIAHAEIRRGICIFYQKSFSNASFSLRISRKCINKLRMGGLSTNELQNLTNNLMLCVSFEIEMQIRPMFDILYFDMSFAVK